MADLYSQLNVARGASEAEIKKAYRKLAKELHPDKNKDNPKATERFSKVTQAYDILTDKDKRAQYDRGEIDEEGNPRMPFGFGGGGGRSPAARGGGFRGPNGEPFEFGGGEAADLSDLFEGLFGGGRRGGGGGPFGGFGRRSAPPQKGADVAYRLEVPFEDAAAAAGPAGHAGRAARRSTSSCRPASRTAPRSASPARARPGPAAMATRSSPSRSSRTASSAATATISGSICRSRSTRRCSAPRSGCRPSTGR